MNKNIDKSREYETGNNNSLGVGVLLISYCGLGLFMIYKVLELILTNLK